MRPGGQLDSRPVAWFDARKLEVCVPEVRLSTRDITLEATLNFKPIAEESFEK